MAKAQASVTGIQDGKWYIGAKVRGRVHVLLFEGEFNTLEQVRAATKDSTPGVVVLLQGSYVNARPNLYSIHRTRQSWQAHLDGLGNWQRGSMKQGVLYA